MRAVFWRAVPLRFSYFVLRARISLSMDREIDPLIEARAWSRSFTSTFSSPEFATRLFLCRILELYSEMPLSIVWLLNPMLAGSGWLRLSSLPM